MSRLAVANGKSDPELSIESAFHDTGIESAANKVAPEIYTVSFFESQLRGEEGSFMRYSARNWLTLLSDMLSLNETNPAADLVKSLKEAQAHHLMKLLTA